MSDFCRECGAGFPPRDGEGRCIEWEKCRLIEALRAKLAEKEAALAGCVKVLLNTDAALERSRIVFTDWTGPEPANPIKRLLASLPESAKLDAEIIRLAKELVAVIDSGDLPKYVWFNLMDYKQEAPCQAVRARKGRQLP